MNDTATLSPTAAAPRVADRIGWPDDPRFLAWRAFLRAHAAVTRRLETELETDQALSLADYDALIQLAFAPDLRLRMNELADGLMLTRSGVSRLVDRLVGDGLVERDRCSADARGAYAVLTEAGLARLRAATPTHVHGVERHFLDALADADLEPFVRALDALVGRADGPCVETSSSSHPGRQDHPV